MNGELKFEEIKLDKVEELEDAFAFVWGIICGCGTGRWGIICG